MGGRFRAGCGGRRGRGQPDCDAWPCADARGDAVGLGDERVAGPPPIPPPGPLSQPRSLDQVGIPRQLTHDAIPADNPQTPDKVALGQRLFFDGRLSADGTVACSTCHDPGRAFTDGRATSIGIGGRTGQRNAPTILNALYNATQFWDGRAATLEQQAAMPIINPVEMGQPTLDAAVAAVASDAGYRDAFQRVFGRAPDPTNLTRAIASYERTLIAYDTPFDHFIAGEANAIDDSAKRGWQLFNTRGRCNKCHALSSKVPDPSNFTDNDFHNIGIGIIRHDVVAQARQAEQLIRSGDMAAVDRAAIQTDLSVLGRFLVTKKEADIASFKTPDIRNVLVTAPYFHDGSQQTLWDVVDHYNKGDGLKNPWLDEDIQPLALSEHDIDDLVAFMASLTSPDYADLAARSSGASARLRKSADPSAIPSDPSVRSQSSPNRRRPEASRRRLRRFDRVSRVFVCTGLGRLPGLRSATSCAESARFPKMVLKVDPSPPTPSAGRTSARFALVGAIAALVGGAFLYAGAWLSPHELTPARFIDTFEQVNGVHPGFRRNHAKGVCVGGSFESNGQGARLSKAVVFQPGASEVVGRFALAGGKPDARDAAQTVRSMALRFSLPGGQEWRTGMNNIPVFAARTPEAFHDQLIALAPDPSTGKPDPVRANEFLTRHPESARALELIKAQTPSSGFYNSRFNSLNAFEFVDAAGRTTAVRWSMVPTQPYVPADTPARPSDPNFLFDALIARLHRMPLQWHLVVIIAQAGDPTNDATVVWPADREQLDVGTLTIDRIESEDTGSCRTINFDPLVLPDGIAGSDDPLLSARSATYSTSFTRRVGEPVSPSAVTASEVGQ